MWKKVAFAVVLVAFVGLQFANSLNCYSCNSPDSCKKPGTQFCSNATANATSDYLNTIHSNVPRTAGSPSFACMNMTYYLGQNRVKTHEFKGCYHPTVPVCGLTYNGSQSNNFERNCKTCNTERCNHNPAGTYSKSTFTIIGSAIAVLLAKLLH